MTKDTIATSDSPWAPLSRPLFRAFWIVTIVSNVGSWMHEVGAGWLMATLSPSPVYVSLIQAASSLPVFLLALPAGALSDIIDRRRYLLVAQLYLVLVASALAIIVFVGTVTPNILVLMTFMMGIGSAMMMPAWAALTPEIVDRPILQPAIALNSMGMNVARALGPALAGIIIARVGTHAVFAINAVSFFGVVLFLYRWRRAPRPTRLPVERFSSAVRAGLRYARHAPSLHAAAIRGVGFFLFASVIWALLPLIAKDHVGGGPTTYGILVAAIGAGAVSGAIGLPSLRARLSRDALVAAAGAALAVSLAILANVHTMIWVVLIMFVIGMAWIVALSTLQVTAQLALPDWVRARGLSVFMTVFMGAMALGSVTWGQFTAATSLTTALTAAAAGLLLAIPLTWRWRLASVDTLDLSPSMHWPEPAVGSDVAMERGPVLITIHYDVVAEQVDRFLDTMQALRGERLRDGAYAWGLFENTETENRFVETFEVASWLEHLRQHDRVTESDRALQLQVRQLLKAGTTPVISHYVGRRRANTLPGYKV